MRIPLIETAVGKQEKNTRPKHADRRPLPAAYMSEYYVLGLVVDRLDRAVEILNGKGFKIDEEDFGAEVEILGPKQLPEIVRMLAEAGVYSSIGDVIDSVCQG